jgi:hypothetical protein
LIQGDRDAADNLLFKDRILRAHRNYKKLQANSIEVSLNQNSGKRTDLLAMKAKQRNDIKEAEKIKRKLSMIVGDVR